MKIKNQENIIIAVASLAVIVLVIAMAMVNHNQRLDALEQLETEYPNDGKVRFHYVLFDSNNKQYSLDCVGQRCEFLDSDNFKLVVDIQYREGNEWEEPPG